MMSLKNPGIISKTAPSATLRFSLTKSLGLISPLANEKILLIIAKRKFLSIKNPIKADITISKKVKNPPIFEITKLEIITSPNR